MIWDFWYKCNHRRIHYDLTLMITRNSLWLNASDNQSLYDFILLITTCVITDTFLGLVTNSFHLHNVHCKLMWSFFVFVLFIISSVYCCSCFAHKSHTELLPYTLQKKQTLHIKQTLQIKQMLQAEQSSLLSS